MMARIVVDGLVRHLERSGILVVKTAPRSIAQRTRELW